MYQPALSRPARASTLVAYAGGTQWVVQGPQFVVTLPQQLTTVHAFAVTGGAS